LASKAYVVRLPRLGVVPASDGGFYFFEQALRTTGLGPAEVTTDRAAAYPAVLEELLPAAWHRTDQYAHDRAGSRQAEGAAAADTSLKQERSARVIVSGHASVQNVRRGHYELAVESYRVGGWRSRSRSWP
jgi:transposase-like protein